MSTKKLQYKEFINAIDIPSKYIENGENRL